MITETMTVLPLVTALAQAVFFMSGTCTLPDNWHQQWNCSNEQQQVLMQDYASQCKDEPLLNKVISQFAEGELEACAAKSHKALNAILKSKNFDIQLEPFSPDGFGMLATLDIKTQWREKGHSATIHSDRKSYNGVLIKGKDNYKVFRSDGHPYPIAALYTQSSNDVVFLTEATQQKKSFALLDAIRTIKEHLQEASGYVGVKFPKVDIDHKTDVSWLLDMKFGDHRLVQALQQTKLSLNEEGAQAKSAVAASMDRCIPKYMEITNPYLMWWEKKEVAIPVIAALIAKDSWQAK